MIRDMKQGPTLAIDEMEIQTKVLSCAAQYK
jgi:hypothetical protein